ncbi:hypothetical protein KUCAC02_009629 [Chaenocephalus aceratus]|nr:hypothetical protein KUCAC02_009629 [Chaenocephalus aceratus]
MWRGRFRTLKDLVYEFVPGFMRAQVVVEEVRESKELKQRAPASKRTLAMRQGEAAPMGVEVMLRPPPSRGTVAVEQQLEPLASVEPSLSVEPSPSNEPSPSVMVDVDDDNRWRTDLPKEAIIDGQRLQFECSEFVSVDVVEGDLIDEGVKVDTTQRSTPMHAVRLGCAMARGVVLYFRGLEHVFEDIRTFAAFLKKCQQQFEIAGVRYSILDVAVARPALYARGLQVLWRCFQLLARQLRLRHAAEQKVAALKGELGLWKQKAGEALQRLEVLQATASFAQDGKLAGSDSSALEEAFDIHQVFEQVFPEEVEQNMSFLSSIRPDLQEQLLRDIDVRVDLVGGSLDHGFRALNDSLSAKCHALNSLILQGPPRAADRDLAMALRPHYTEGGASKDKLSSLQRAFFLWKLDVLQIKDLKLKAAVIAGEAIWLPGWRPHRSTSLPSYLGERIKTALRKRRRSDKREPIWTLGSGEGIAKSPLQVDSSEDSPCVRLHAMSVLSAASERTEREREAEGSSIELVGVSYSEHSFIVYHGNCVTITILHPCEGIIVPYMRPSRDMEVDLLKGKDGPSFNDIIGLAWRRISASGFFSVPRANPRGPLSKRRSSTPIEVAEPLELVGMDPEGKLTTHGLVETLHGTIQRSLNKPVEGQPKRWDRLLQGTMFALRTKTQLTSKFSPYLLMFGREARCPSEVPEKYEITEEKVSSSVQMEEVFEGLKKQEAVFAEVKGNVAKSQDKIRKRKEVIRDIWAGRRKETLWAKYGPYKVYSENLLVLAPGKELEGEIVNAYLSWVGAKAGVFIVDSYLMTSLWQGTHRGSLRKDVQLPEEESPLERGELAVAISLRS